MKQTLLLGALALSMLCTSCGSGASLKTTKDSVSYAIGVTEGSGIRSFDSTLNVEAFIAGFRAAFKKDTTMTIEQAQAQIQIYMQAKQVEDQKAAKIKFSADSTANVKASAEYMAAKEKEGYKKTASGILYKIANEGAEPKSALSDTLTVHYTLTLVDGTKKDSSHDRKQPMTFANETGKMIPGFTEAVGLMGKGGKGTFVIPATLGYGLGQSQVGPAQVLVFDIEVLNIVHPKVKK